MVAGDNRGLHSVNELSEARLWKTLDSIDGRLVNIEGQLKELVRLEERVNSHDQALSRYGNRLDMHDMRLRDTELWQANHGDKAYLDNTLSGLRSDISNIGKRLSNVEDTLNISKGQKDIGKEALKWLSGILASLLIYYINKGN